MLSSLSMRIMSHPAGTLQKRLSERGYRPKNLLVSVDANKREKFKIEYISRRLSKEISTGYH